MKALLIVDVQNDFCPGGPLGVNEGDQVIPVLNAAMNEANLVIASKDWHPAQTEHFAKWPVHCVQGTAGAEWPAGLDRKHIEQVFLKGTGTRDDGYSAFEATNEDLEKYLRSRKVDTLLIGGLATDYCVRASALDARRKGFDVTVIEDAVRGVELKAGDVIRAVDEMKAAGVRFVKLNELSRA